MTCTHQTHLGQQWLQLRKELGTIACLEKARSIETVCGAEGQGKMCMAKAILPESQFAAAYQRSSVAERLTRHLGWKEDMSSVSSLFRLFARVVRESVHPAHPPYRGISERTGRLNTSYLATHVITGCPTAGSRAIRRPVWVRSRHSIQTPEVMFGTAATQLADGIWNKLRTTCANLQIAGRRTAATAIQQPTAEVC